MFDQQEHQRFQELRQREHALNDAESAELAHLVDVLEMEEALKLASGIERTKKECEAIESQNGVLQALVVRKEALVQRLRTFLAEAKAERGAIERELTAVVAECQDSKTSE